MDIMGYMCKSMYSPFIMEAMMNSKKDWKLEKIKKQEDRISALEEELSIIKESAKSTSGSNFDDRVELQQKITEWRKLIKETEELEREYRVLVSEVKDMKVKAIRSIYGGNIRYKIASWLMK